MATANPPAARSAPRESTRGIGRPMRRARIKRNRTRIRTRDAQRARPSSYIQRPRRASALSLVVAMGVSPGGAKALHRALQPLAKGGGLRVVRRGVEHLLQGLSIQRAEGAHDLVKLPAEIRSNGRVLRRQVRARHGGQGLLPEVDAAPQALVAVRTALERGNPQGPG